MLLMAALKTSMGSLPDFATVWSSAQRTMRSATAFLPESMTTFMDLASSTLPNLGSGRISRLGTSRRRGIFDFLVTVQLSRLSAATAPISRGPLTCLGDMPGLHDSGRRAAGYCEFGYCG